jgi:membrane protein DedA with SNARE-associated domain
MRTVMPLAIGLSGYSWRRYLLLDAIGVAIWASGLGLAAYHLGAALETILGDFRRYQLYVFGALLLIALGFWLRQRLRRSAH